MKRFYSFLIISFALIGKNIGQTSNDVLNLLVQRNLISQNEADSLRADAAIKQQEADAKRKSFPANAGKPIQLGGYSQVRYQNLDEPGKIDGFDVRRARFDVKGIISPYFGYRLQTEFGGTSGVKLIDAYADVKLYNFFNLTIGQQKVPFSLENLASSNKIELIDRSQVVEALVARGKDVIGNHNGRDIGVQATGTILSVNNRSIVDYRIGIFNGGGVSSLDNNETKDVVARLILHPITGLDLGGSYYNGVGRFGTPVDNRGRNRMGFELSYDLKNFSVRGEYIDGKDGDIKRTGHYAQAGYFILPQKLQVVAKYDFYDPNTDIDKNAATWYIVGLNYNFNTTTRAQLGYTFREEEGTSINNNSAVIQFQIGF